MDEKDEKEYELTLEQASAYFEKAEWDIAEELYKEALEIKPGDKLCLSQLAKIEDASINSVYDHQSFEKTLVQAKVYFEREEWEIADELYKEALEIKPDDKVCLEQLAKINDALKNSEVDQLEYNKTVEQAKVYFEREEWEIADELYKEALEIKPDDKVCKEQLTKIESSRRSSENNKAEYEKIVKQASEYFEKEEWDKAKEHYLIALNIIPQNELPLLKFIEECDLNITKNETNFNSGAQDIINIGEKENVIISDNLDTIEEEQSKIDKENIVPNEFSQSTTDNVNISDINNGTDSWPSDSMNMLEEHASKIIGTNPKSKIKWIITGGLSIFVLLIVSGYLFFKKEKSIPSQTLTPTPTEMTDTLVIKTDLKVKSIDSSQTLSISPNVQEEQNIEPIKINNSSTKRSLLFENGNSYIGNIKDGKMHGKGTYYFHKGGLISKNDRFERLANDGDSIVGTWNKGELYIGNLYGKDGILKELIIIGRN